MTFFVRKQESITTPAATLYGETGGVSPQSPLAVSAEKVLSSQVSGTAYAPFALANKTALARSEANQRASAASQIHQAGFGGTSMGAGLGNATEAALLRNRFDNAIGLEQARQTSMLEGAKAVNAWEAGKMENEQGALAQADSNWKGAVLSNEGFINAWNAAKTPAEKNMLVEQLFGTSPQVSGWMQTANYGNRFDAVGMIDNAIKGSSVGYQALKGGRDLLRSIPKYAGFSDAELDKALTELGFTDTLLGVGGMGEVEDVNNMTPAALSAELKDGKINYNDKKYEKLASAYPKTSVKETVEGKRKGTIIQGAGIGRANNPGHTQIIGFENAYEKQIPVNIDGKLYYVESVKRTDGNFAYGGEYKSGTTTYTLIDPVTGEQTKKVTKPQTVTF